MPIKIFFSRKGSKGKWRVFITTYTSLSFIKMIQHILLTLKFRIAYYTTFSHIRKGIIESRLKERLWGLFIELMGVWSALSDDFDEMDILQRILEDDRAYEMISLLLP